MANKWGKKWKQWQVFFSWAPKTEQPWNEKMLASWKKSWYKPRQCIKKQRHHFADKGPYSQNYGFSSSHVEIWELDHKKTEHWRIDAFKPWCWRRLLRVPWTARKTNQSILKEINPEYSLEGLMKKLKLQYFGHLMGRADYWKRPWFWERLKAGREGVTEDKMVGWHLWLNEREFEQTLGYSEGPGSLAGCSPWGCKEWDMTELMNNSNNTL